MQSIQTLFTNATFRTGKGPTACGVGVDASGLIAQVFFSESELAAANSGKEAIVDLGGAYVLPAFEDAHNHIAARARTVFEIDMRGKDSTWEGARAAIRERTRTTASGEWIVCHGWNEARWGSITREDLDAISKGHGIFLINISFHGGVVNTKGCELLEKKGYPTGHEGKVTEAEFDSTIIATAPSTEGYMKAIPLIQERLLSLGIGAVHDMHALMPEQLEAFWNLEKQSALKFPVLLYVNPRLLEWEKLPAYISAPKPMVRLAGLKLFLDGAIGVSTAAIRGSYADGTGSGVLRHSTEECKGYIRKAASLGLSHIAMHCIGDSAVSQAVELMVSMKKELGESVSAWRFEHFEMPDDAALAALAAHGGIASMQPNFSWDSDNYQKRLGERAALINPLRKVKDADVTLVLGSDDAPSGPLQGIHWALKAPHESQRLTLEETLHCYTKTPAELAGAGNRRGEIAEGFEANFTVLDKDVADTSAQVKSVWIRGKQKFVAK